MNIQSRVAEKAFDYRQHAVFVHSGQPEGSGKENKG
jgi:hypothetical protein